MSSTFTINGHTANLAATQKAFTAAGFNGKALQGGDLTPDKIAQLIHPDGQPVKMEDLRRLQSDSGLRLQKLLQSNGVDLYAATPDFDKTLSEYLQDRFTNGKANTDLIPDKMWEDPNFVMRAVKYSGTALQFADAKLRDDPEIVLTALKSDSLALEYVDKKLKSISKIWKNPDFVLRAVQYSGSTLRFADQKLRQDPKIVLAAVKSDGLALEYADKKLKSNPEIVKEAVKNNYMAFEFAAPAFKADPKFILSMIQTAAQDPNVGGTGFVKEIIDLANSKAREDPMLILAAGKIDLTAFALIPEKLQKDKGFVMQMVQISGMALQYADEKYQRDPQVVMAAVKQDGDALYFADPLIQKNNPDILKVAVRQSTGAFDYIDPDLKQQDFLVELAQINHNILDKLGPIRKEKVWNALQPILEQKGIHFPKKMMISYDIFKESLKPMTDSPERFRSFQTVQTYWNNRQNLSSYKGDLPLAAVVYPPKKGDKTGAYASSPVLDDLAESGKFYALYREASTQAHDESTNRQQVFGAVKEASQSGKYLIHTLVLGGHGNGKTLALSGKDLGGKNQQPSKTEEEEFDEAYYIDTEDFKTGLKEIGKYLDPNGQVWIRSCYSGKGGEVGENLTNAAAAVLPNTMSVYGYRKSTITSGLVVNNDLSLNPSIIPQLPYVTHGRRTPTQQVAGATTQIRLSGI